MRKIAFAAGHLSTGGMPRFVYNSIKYLDRDTYEPYLFEGSYAGVNEIRDQILAIDGLTHHLCPKDQFLDFVRKYQIDLIHYHDWDVYARPDDIASVETVHNPFHHIGDIGHADLYLLISDHQIPMYLGKRWERIDTFIDTHEFNPERFDAESLDRLRSQWLFQPDEAIVLCVGILAPYKNQAELLKFWNLEGTATLVFVGPLADNFRDYWAPLIKKYAPVDSVRFFGAQKEIVELMAIADVAINCSAHEGCCLSNLEAASMGLPLVVSDIPQNAQVFRDGETALVRPVDHRFVEAVREVLDTPALATRLGTHAREMVNERYSVERYARRIENVYGRLIVESGLKNLEQKMKSVLAKQPQSPIGSKKPRIIFVDPDKGLGIPPTGWGAVEKIIWELASRLRGAGYDAEWLPLGAVISRADELAGAVVHCHFWHEALKLAEAEIPYILTIDDPYPLMCKPGDEAYQRYERAIEASITTIISTEQETVHWPHLAHKMTVIPHGVDVGFFTPHLSHVGDYILSVGQIVDYKRFDLVVEAGMMLDMPVKIAGRDGGGLAHLQETMASHPKAEYLGEVSHEELRALYQSAAVFALASERETFGLVVMEAMASGLPVVITQTCLYGLEGEGILRTEPDPVRIGLRIAGALREKDRLGKLNAEIAQRYSWDEVVKDYIALYERLGADTFINAPRSPEITDAHVDADAHKKRDVGANAPYRVRYVSDGVLLNVDAEPEVHHYEFKVYQAGELTYHTHLVSRSDCGVWAKGNGNIWYTAYSYLLFRDGELVKSDTLNLEGKSVLIDFRTPALGDTLAWMPYCIEFATRHGCEITVRTDYTKLFQKLFTGAERASIHFADHADAGNFFFSYPLGVFSQPHEHKTNWRYIPLQQVASDMLGLPHEERRLDLTPLAGTPNFTRPYVCIAPRSTMRAKQWNYHQDEGDAAWQTVVDWLVAEGYEVVWISREDCTLKNVVDKSGDLPLEDRITDLTHAEFFVGLPAGLSWLAWCSGMHVFMISGFSREWCEFQSNVTRISRQDVCRGCFNNNHEWTRDWAWCPEGKNYQCTALISPSMVIDTIREWLNRPRPAEPSPVRVDDGVQSLKTDVHANLLYWIVRELNPQYVAELGVFQGFTTIHLAWAIRDCPAGRKLYALDDFSFAGTSREVFEKNLRAAGVAEYVKIIEGKTAEGIGSIDVPLGFAYIDADHEYAAAKADFENCWRRLAPGGIIALHDSTGCHGVQRVIEEIEGHYRIIDFYRDEGLTLVQKDATKGVKVWDVRD